MEATTQTAPEPTPTTPPDDGRRYKIVRFSRKETPRHDWRTTRRTIVRGLTLAEARRHCSDPSTHGRNWFDGYTAE